MLDAEVKAVVLVLALALAPALVMALAFGLVGVGDLDFLFSRLPENSREIVSGVFRAKPGAGDGGGPLSAVVPIEMTEAPSGGWRWLCTLDSRELVGSELSVGLAGLEGGMAKKV